MTPKSFTRLAAAALAATTLATPMLAQAHDYRPYYDDRSYDDACTDKIHDNGTAGAIIGGIAGALLGSNIAHHGGRTGGALIGAAAGAAVGSNIARSSTKQSCRPPEYRASYDDGYATPGYDDGDGYRSYERHDNGRHHGWYNHRWNRAYDGEDWN